MPASLIHIHSSEGSIADSAAKIKDIVAKAKAIGAPGCSITDHGSMSGALKFYKECKAQGINPILGVELYTNNNREKKEKANRRNSHLCLYAKNFAGYKELVYLQGEAVHNFYFKPRTTNDLILKMARNGNLICTTACLGSELNKYFELELYDKAEEMVLEFKEVFGRDSFFLEAQINEMPEQREYNNHLIRIAKKLDVQMVLGLDAHYVEQEDHFLQQLMFLIRDKKTVDDLNKNDGNDDTWQFETKSLWIKTDKEIRECAKKYGYGYSDKFIQELLDNTNKINDLVDIEIPFYDYKFPKHQHKENISSKELLINRLKDGLREKIKLGFVRKDQVPEYMERIKLEVDVLTNKGRDFADYFLFLSDVKNFVKEQGGLLGSGRGSAAGSVVAYLLDIVKVDPIKEGLIFERFINEARLATDAADIDVDIDSDTLPKVEEWLKDTYGRDSVAHVANYTKFSIRNTVKDVARALGVNDDMLTLNKITKSLDDGSEDLAKEWMRAERRFGKSSKEYKWLEAHRSDVLKWANKLVGCTRNVGQHASGRVIVPGKLIDHVPLVKHKGEVLIAYTEGVTDRELPEIGLLKLDLLGLNTASVINDTLMMLEKRGVPCKYTKDTIFQVDKEDPKILQEFAKGNTDNIFQFASIGMKKLLQQLIINRFEDITLCNALYRPGALNAGMHTQAIANKMKTEIKYIHPILENALEKSYGIPAYQESILEIFKVVGGFTMVEADLARKTIKLLGKKIKEQSQLDKLDKMLDKFKDGARKNGLNEEQINDILKWLSAASDYSFNRSHSFCYSLNSYITMYLKIYHPLEYYCSLLNRTNNIDDKLYTAITQARMNKVSVEFININRSEWEFTIADEKIYCGFNFIKGVSTKDIDKLTLHRPFDGPLDFIRKVIESGITKRTVNPLIHTGVCSGIYDNRKKLLEMHDRIKKICKRKSFTWEQAQDIINEVDLDDGIDDYTNQERADFELDHFGFYLQCDIVYMYQRYINMFKAMKINEMNMMPKNISTGWNGLENTYYKFHVYGVITGSQIKKTKKGKEYRILTISDRGKRKTDSLTLKVWDFDMKQAERIFSTDANNLLKIGSVVLVKLVENDYGFALQKSRGSTIEDLPELSFVNLTTMGLEV